MATEIVTLPIRNGGSFHSYVSLPESIAFSGIAFKKSQLWVMFQAYRDWEDPGVPDPGSGGLRLSRVES